MPIYKQDNFINKVKAIIKYILIFPILERDEKFGLFVLSIVIVVVYILFIILIIIGFNEKYKIKYYGFINTIMRIILPRISFTFFGQIFEFLILIFFCDQNVNINKNNKLNYPSGSVYYLFLILSFLAALFFVIISYITISMFYKPVFMEDTLNIMKKINSFPDLVFFLNKIIIILLTNISNKNPIYIWFILFILFLSTYANMIFSIKYNNYENKLLSELHKFFSIILFCSIFNLVLGKIFSTWGFNATHYLFLFGSILVLIRSFLYNNILNNYSTIDFKELNTSFESFLYINEFSKLIKSKHLYRENNLIFETLISNREKNCIDKNCKLKNYLKSLEKGESNDFFLFQYCQHLYEIAIKKFPEDIMLKVNYIVYLIIQMSKIKLAEKLLYSIQLKCFNLENNYITFCCKKFIEQYKVNSEQLFLEENKNVIKRIEYDKLYKEFKKEIKQASLLYYDFWNILFKYHIQGVENLDKLKNIGKEIITLINTIDNKFFILHNVKVDDYNLLYLYAGFIRYVLGNKKKYENLKNKLISISNFDKIKNFEIDYTNFDLKYYEDSDEYKFIILSAEEESLGKILNISHNASKIFGYLRQELIGKNISILMPNICQKEFIEYLRIKTHRLKIKFYDELINNKEYFPEVVELFINAKDKSKYLVPIYIKMIFVQTEDSNHTYILSLSYHDNIILDKMNKIFNLEKIYNPNIHKEENLYKNCIVLTDKNFIIQTFSANCQEHLGLNTILINSNIDLTRFIIEFNESVNKMIFKRRNENKDKSVNEVINLIPESYRSFHRSERKSQTKKEIINSIPREEILKYKRYIADKIYSESKLITWNTEALEKHLINNSSLLNTNINSNMNKILKKENSKNKLFSLIIKKTEFNNKNIGYTFLFRREQVNIIEKNNYDIKNINDIYYQNKQKFHKRDFSLFKSSDDLNRQIDIINNHQKDIKDYYEFVKKEIRHNKSQKKIKKAKKSSRKDKFQKIGLIEKKINNYINVGKKEKIIPIKKCSFKNLSSKLSLKQSQNNTNNIFDEKVIFESVLKEQNYIPKCDFNFIYNKELMSFQPSISLLKTNIFIESLKLEANKKINIYQKIPNMISKQKSKDSSSTFSSNKENESFEEEEEYPNSKSNPDSNKSIKKKTLLEKNKKEDNIKNNMDNQYYRVSHLNKIRFMVYDFEKEMIIENEGQKEIKSEVENIIINNKLKLPILVDKDGNDPSIKINKFISEYSKKEIINKEKFIKVKSLTQIKSNQILKKKKELYKRIEIELNKKEKEKSIYLYSILCLFLNLILLGLGVFSLYFIISKLQVFKNHLLLLVYTSLLRYHINLGIYHTRIYMLTNLNVSGKIFENYEIIHNRTNYIEKLYKNLENDYFSGTKYLQEIIEIDIALSKSNKDKIYKKPFTNLIMGNEFTYRNVTSTFKIGISQIFSHFYYLITNIQKLRYDSVEMLNFIYNALNNAGAGLNEIIDIFIDEVKNKKDYYRKLTYIILFSYFIILVIMFFLIQVYYQHITFKRNMYASTFYQINLSFIKQSIMNCEKFFNRITENESLSNKEIILDNIDNSTSYSNKDGNKIFKEQMKDDINSNFNANKTTKGNMRVKRNKGLLVIFIFFLSIIFLYMLIPLLEFNKYLEKFEIMALYEYHMLHFHNNVINIYNAFNEYLFYRESRVDNTPILEYIDKTINNLYNTISEDINYQATNSRNIPGLYEIFAKIQKEQLYNSTNINDTYLDSITSLGYYNFISFMIYEIKVKINYEKILYARKYKDIWDSNIDERSITLFNSIHSDIDYVFNLVVLYNIEEEINLTRNLIIKNLDSKNSIYISVYIIYIVGIIFLYIFYWNQKIFGIQEQIYKAKIVLNIIPIEILESQTNINTLVGISDLN